MTGWVSKAASAGAGVTGSGVLILAAGLQAAMPVSLAATSIATSDIPARLLPLYQQAAGRCPGLQWPVLAGVGKVESDHGRAASLVSGAGAQGPMQFLPATWRRYGVDGDGDRRRDPFVAADAIPAAADYLCTLGAGRHPQSALIAYNCGSVSDACRAVSAGYATQVLAWAARYATAGSGQPGAAASVAVQAALSQVGTPYVWGGEAPGGFDCSGLVQWAYAKAGVSLPRVAQDQFAAGPRLPTWKPLAPGDLMFFGPDEGHVDHVGIFLGDGRMVDAPHTGALIRVEPISGFSPGYLAATRPAAAELP